MNWGSSAVGQVSVSRMTGTVMGLQTVWMTPMNKTAVSCILHCMPTRLTLKRVEIFIMMLIECTETLRSFRENPGFMLFGDLKISVYSNLVKQICMMACDQWI